MKQRMTYGGISVTAVVAIIIFAVSLLTPQDILAQVAENIRQAKTYSFEMATEAKSSAGQVHRMTQKISYQAPGSYHFDGELPMQGRQTRIIHKDRDGR